MRSFRLEQQYHALRIEQTGLSERNVHNTFIQNYLKKFFEQQQQVPVLVQHLDETHALIVRPPAHYRSIV